MGCLLWVFQQLSIFLIKTILVLPQTRAATIEAKTNAVTLYRVNDDAFKAVLNNQSNDDPELLEKIDQAINQGLCYPALSCCTVWYVSMLTEVLFP